MGGLGSGKHLPRYRQSADQSGARVDPTEQALTIGNTGLLLWPAGWGTVVDYRVPHPCDLASRTGSSGEVVADSPQPCERGRRATTEPAGDADLDGRTRAGVLGRYVRRWACRTLGARTPYRDAPR